jgi:hypothetical protein
MRPLAVLLGILTGSIVTIAISLSMVLIIFLILHHQHEQLDMEMGALLQSCALFAVLAAIAFASFLGEVRERRWRRYAQAGLVLGLALAAWVYWPRR